MHRCSCSHKGRVWSGAAAVAFGAAIGGLIGNGIYSHLNPQPNVQPIHYNPVYGIHGDAAGRLEMHLAAGSN